MHRNTLLETAGRVMHQAVRLTLNKTNDNPMMQELSFDGMNGDARSIVERVQGFGMTSMPLPRDEQQGGSGGGGGGGGGGGATDQKGPAAEGIAIFLGGQRNHPVVIAVDDRRHRPMGLKPGESFQYDDQQQGTLIRRDATYMLSLDDDGSGAAPAAVMLRDAEGKATGQSQKKERFVSVRHVVKKKQQRPGQQGGSGGSGGGGGASAGTLAASGGSGGQQQDYKHEGDTVNNEMRVSAKRIEFRSGDTVVGYYDKQANKWAFIGEVHLGVESASHPAYGVSGGVGMTTATSGAGAVLVNATKPGPPTSMDGMPFEARDAEIAALKERVAALEARIANG